MLFSSLAQSLLLNYSGVVFDAPSDHEITEIAPYEKSAVIPSEQCLSLFTPSEMDSAAVMPPNIICIGTISQELFMRIKESGSNYILVPEGASSEVMCYVMRLFGDAIKQQKLYSDIMYMLFSDVDLSSIFCEFTRETGFQLLAIDISGKVMAQTKPLIIDHPHWQNSIEKGYLDQFLIEFIMASRVKNKMSLSTQPFSLYCSKLKLNIKVARVVADGTLIGYVFMGGVSDVFPANSGRLMLAFAKKLKSILISNRDFVSFRVNMHQNILSDLIDGASEEEIIQRIRSANLAFPANMRAMVLKASFFRGANYLYSVLLPEISALLPTSPKFIRSGNIVVLLEVSSSGDIDPEVYDKLEEFAKSHNVHIGVSNMFDHPAEFPTYYHQALQAQGVAKYSPNMHGLFFFSDYGFYILLNRMEDKELLDNIKLPLLSEIENYDAEKNSALYETLKVYAQTGFSKTKTAEMMYLHRNTVNYRIQQLESQFNIDFSDPTLLFKLLYSFYIDSYLKNRYSDLFISKE